MGTKRKHKQWVQLRLDHPLKGFLAEGTEQWVWGQVRVLWSPLEQHPDGDWQHASISCRDRYPSWSEIKECRYRFFPEDAEVMQILPPVDEYINLHKNCFHLWSPIGRRLTPITSLKGV